MNQEECKEIKQALDLFLNESLERILMSNPTDRRQNLQVQNPASAHEGQAGIPGGGTAGSRHFTAIWTGMRRQIMSLGFWTDPSARRRLHPVLEMPLFW